MHLSILNRQSSIARCSNPRKFIPHFLAGPHILIILGVLCVLGVLCGLAGCQQVSTVDPNYIKAFAQDVNDLVIRVDAYQQASTAAIEQLVIQNAIDPNKASKILAANADVDRLQATIQQVTAALQKADYSDSRGLLTLIQSAQAANAATAPWNPYAAPIAAALTILSTILTILLRRESAKTEALGLKYQAHKQGVEKTMKQASTSAIPDVKNFGTVLYDNIGAARSALGVT